jgi:outer membrane receptor protein involved in Fe transport
MFYNALVIGTATGQIPNPSLKWEQSQKTDIGLDLKLFDSKVSIVTDYFTDTRKDLLIRDILYQELL